MTQLSDSLQMTPALSRLSDFATEAHTRIQQNHEGINPVVGVSRGMRAQGIPADAMTIDCLKTGKRIIIILHDQEPQIVRYQFSYKEQDPSDTFEVIASELLGSNTLYDWMETYFSEV